METTGNQKKLFQGRALAGTGAAAVFVATGAAFQVQAGGCVDVGCIAGGIIYYAALAGGVAGLVIGAIGLRAMERAGSGVNWRSGMTWTVAAVLILVLLMIWLMNFEGQPPYLLWSIYGDAGFLLIALTAVHVRERKAGRRGLAWWIAGAVAGIGCLCFYLDSRTCAQFVTHSQHMCWAEDFKGKPEWHTLVGPYERLGPPAQTTP